MDIKSTYTLGHGIKKMFGIISDDFDWRIYNLYYRNEMSSIAKTHTLVINNADFAFNNNKLIKTNSNIYDLHPNHHLLYETLLQLNPDSLLELGCGGGDHLHNLETLAPGKKLYGFDLSSDQLSFLKQRHPQLSAKTRQFDCTLPFPLDTPLVDVAYTQAVIMHIQTGNAHMVALSNLFRVATKQVVLMENWKRHDFMSDIQKLFSLKIIQWNELYFYYREIEDIAKPHLMIVSSTPINNYKELKEYSILSSNV